MRLAVCTVLAFALTAPMLTPREPQGWPVMRTGSLTEAPMGAVRFCLRLPKECEPVRRHMGSPARMADLVKVNREVNEDIDGVSDLEAYGMTEHWTIPLLRGDCEDFALLKRKRLIAMGWPSSALLIAVVRRGGVMGEGHAVLVATLPHGDFVLDVNTDRVLPWYATKHWWVSRQSALDPRLWVDVID